MMETMTLKDRVAADGKKYDEIWTLIEDENIINKVKFGLVGTEDNKFEIDYVAKAVPEDCAPGDEYENIIIHLWAGKNGSGKWNEYFTDAISIMNRLTRSDDNCVYWINANENVNVGKMFKNAWLINWENDCADDVSNLYIGVRL